MDAEQNVKDAQIAREPEKLLSFHVYTSDIYRQPADKAWCVAAVHNGRVGFHQCGRRPKHEYGGHGWCSQHYPPNEHARRAASQAKYDAEWAAREARYATEEREEKMRDAAVAALQKIADGHNDPRGLAMEVLGRTQDPT